MTREEAIKKLWSLSYIGTQAKVDTDTLINEVYDDFESKFNFIEQYKFSDKCPEYKTIEQFEMFIEARETDIKNIKIAIKDAKIKIKEMK